MREPAFWWRKAGLAAALLAPFGFVYGAVAARRMTMKGVSVGYHSEQRGRPVPYLLRNNGLCTTSCTSDRSP